MIFKIRFEAKVGKEVIKGIQSEAGWYMINQQGRIYESGPLQPIRKCGDEYIKIEPLIKINDEYLTIEEIEQRIDR